MSPRINGERLWQTLMTMAEIGATPKGGCNRQALTDLDQQGRDLFVSWAKAAGCSIRIDKMGNIFARRAGRDNNLPAVVTGSHLDTQPTGGKFDGVYGVLAGLEVIRSLNDHQIETDAPLEVSVWTNEEGARFSPAMVGSGVWCGEFSLDYGHSRSDKEGCRLGDELQRIGYLGPADCAPFPIKGFIELHIEQGPILEQEELTIGVVQGVQGMNWFDLTLHGSPVHAGPTPMEQRRDPFMALHPILRDLYVLAEEFKPWSRVTFGDLQVAPGSRNTVPQTLTLAVDLRHPEQVTLDTMEARLRQLVERHCQSLQLAFDIREEWRSPAVSFNQDCIDAIETATTALGYKHKAMFSGAGHDSVYVSRVVPTAMIFIPCKDGISHNEAEYASPQDISAGANVLLHALLQLSKA